MRPAADLAGRDSIRRSRDRVLIPVHVSSQPRVLNVEAHDRTSVSDFSKELAPLVGFPVEDVCVLTAAGEPALPTDSIFSIWISQPFVRVLTQIPPAQDLVSFVFASRVT
jgi:hypothetical protein